MSQKALFCVVLAVIGCSGPSGPPLPKVVPVTGKVTLDGKPLANANLEFIPTAGGVEASGKTNAEGVYELAIRANKGTPQGNYKVTIEKRVKPDGSELTEGGGVGEQVLPTKYWERATTELTATVPAEGGTIDFPLTLK